MIASIIQTDLFFTNSSNMHVDVRMYLAYSKSHALFNIICQYIVQLHTYETLDVDSKLHSIKVQIAYLLQMNYFVDSHAPSVFKINILSVQLSTLQLITELCSTLQKDLIEKTPNKKRLIKQMTSYAFEILLKRKNLLGVGKQS